jgi:tetratricopeptide (TPR) repeat protein
MCGPILRVAEPLYIKRQPASESDASVSVGWRLHMDVDRLRRALAHHRHQLLGALAATDLEPDERQIIELAAEAAAFRRWVLFSSGRFDLTSLEEDRLASAICTCETLGTDASRATLGRLHLALSRYKAQRGEYELATQHAQIAVGYTPDHAEAVVQQAEMWLRAGRTAEAIVSLRRAAELQPMGIGLARLDAECARQLANSGLPQGTPSP